MSLRQRLRAWKIRRLLHEYRWAQSDYYEWRDRVDTSDPRDKAKQVEQLDYLAGKMAGIVGDLWWKYGFDDKQWYKTGDLWFHMHPSYGHVVEAITVVYDY